MGGKEMLLTEKEILQILKISRTTLSKLRKNGLPFIRITDKAIRYCKDDVLEWVNKKHKKGE